MNGEIAQYVGLVCYANAHLRHRNNIPQFFPDNKACKFCYEVVFIADKKKVAQTPDEWFKFLVENNALGVRLVKSRSTINPNDAAFVNIGGLLLEVQYNNFVEYWASNFQVEKQDAPDERIWRVQYQMLGKENRSPMKTRNVADLKDAFKSELLNMKEFSQKHKLESYVKKFTNAIESLDKEKKTHEHYENLYVEGTLSKLAAAMLDTAAVSWVFGGMGSWNDLYFTGEDGKEYEEVSKNFFLIINDVICAAANDSVSE